MLRTITIDSFCIIPPLRRAGLLSNGFLPTMNGFQQPAYARTVYQYLDPNSGQPAHFARDLLKQTVTFYGTDADCDVQLHDDSLAEFHVVLVVEAGLLRFWNLKRDEQVRLNGSRVSTGWLVHGDTLSIGSYDFVIDTNLGANRTPGEILALEDLNDDSAFGGGDCGELTEVHADRDRQERQSNTLVAQALLDEGRISEFQAQWLGDGTFEPFRLGDYEVTDILGAGGMGWIYHARKADSGEKFALKVLSQNSPPDLIARLELEAEAGRRVDHPNLVRTFDLHRHEDICFIALGYIEGLTLSELVRTGGPLAWEQACDFTVQMTEAIAHLHDRQMVHRDIKPANVLIDADGHLTILDLGLVRIDAGDEGAEFSLAMIFGQDRIGTPDYMAPEQTENSFEVDGRADLYSLGCVLFYMLTGEAPFERLDPLMKRNAHASYEVPWALLDVRNVPARGREILARLLAKQPADRPATATEVRDQLSEFCSRNPVTFDFSSIVGARQEEARQRLCRLRERQITETATRVNRNGTGLNFATASTWIETHPPEPGSDEVTTVKLMPPASGELADPKSSTTPITDPRLDGLCARWGLLSPEHQAEILRVLDS